MRRGILAINEMMMGIIILTSVLLALFSYAGILISNTVVKTYSDKLGGVHAIEFSNLARAELTKGGEKKTYDRLASMKGLDELGLAKKYSTINNLINLDKFIFHGSRAEYSHDAFLSLESDYYPVKHNSEVMMEKGRTYLLHIYRIGKENSVVVDIYDEPVCREQATVSGFRMLGCEQVSVLMANDAVKISPVKLKDYIMSGKLVLEKVSSSRDIKPSDIRIQGFSLGYTSECLEAKGKICYRLMGRYSFPAKLYVEINRGDNFRGD